MDNDALQQTLDELRNWIRREVAAGFSTAGDIAENAVEVLSDEHDEKVLRTHAMNLTREAIEAHRREQATWPVMTDCDRLDAAFAELERKGIVARQNFTCCQTCGHYEIGDEITVARRAGREVRGYTFYHMQDTESAVEGGGLYLAYGAVPSVDGALVAVGREIVEALHRHGLESKWDGSGNARIFVVLDWKRRRSP
jgi:uncharacterized protein DUF6891